jgi:hypothetical protein
LNPDHKVEQQQKKSERFSVRTVIMMMMKKVIEKDNFNAKKMELFPPNDFLTRQQTAHI